MDVSELPEPTDEQCNENAVLLRDGPRLAFAAWYPKMGGRAAKAIVYFYRTSLDSDDECFDVLLWHHREYPFRVDSGFISIHHCAASDFVFFGNKVISMMESVERAEDV